MSNPKVANHGLGVATKTSGHEAHAGPPDICLDPKKTVPSPHPNIAPTDRATEHTSGKTKFQDGQVVRVGDAIGPQSDPGHTDTGGGVTSQTYRFEARAGKGSDEIRAEAKPPARTTDDTKQNHGNTTGKLIIPANPNSLADADDDAKKSCSYAESTIKCAHQAAVKKSQILVHRGDTITLVAKRKNAKKVGAAIACHQPQHMKWRVVRTGGYDRLGIELPKLDQEKVGDTLVLDHSWTGPGEAMFAGTMFEGAATFGTGGMTSTMRADQLQRSADQATRIAERTAARRGADRPSGADYQRGIAVTERVNAGMQARDDRTAGIQRAGQTVLLGARIAREWRADLNPVRIQITGAACSGGVSYEVVCYPPHSFEYKFPLDALKKIGKTLEKTMKVVKVLGRLGGVEVETLAVCPGHDWEFTISFKWEEATGHYDIKRVAGFAFSGTLFKWDFDIGVPIANMLQLIPVPGTALLARALNWLIKLVGEAKFGFHITISIGIKTGFTCSWCHATGWEWSISLLTFPIEFNIYFYVLFHVEFVGQLGHLEGRGGFRAAPVIGIEADASGLHIGNEKFTVGCYGTINVIVNTLLYKCNEPLEFQPEALKGDVEKTRWFTMIKN